MLAVVASSWAALPSHAATAFIATMRAPSGSTEAGGQLYRVDPQTGTSTFVGRILIDGAYPIGLTAMAFHPKTNVLYAVTVGIFDAQRASLLTIDPKTAEARLVRRLSLPLTDVSFDPEGQLYGWSAPTGQLAVVDIQTGKVATLGTPTGSAGGAFAIDAHGTAYVAPWSGPATLDRVDLKSGTVVPGPRLAGLRDVATLRSMKFAGTGELLAAQSIRDAHAASLLRIDPATGSVVAVAAIPDDAEAIAVLENEMLGWEMRRAVAIALVVAALVVLAAFFFYVQRKRRKPG